MTMKPLRGQALIDHWIVPAHRGASPVSATVKGRGIEVWVIVELWQQSGHEAARVADSFSMPLAAIDAVLAYYRKYRAEIDEHIRAQARGE